MAQLSLVGRKHPALHTPAVAVAEIDERVRTLAARMVETLRSLPSAAALAAPQVGASVRLVVWGDVVVNPEITELDGREIVDLERCLSLPGRHFEVPRQRRAFVTGLDLDGEPVAYDCEGFDSRVWQHEVDHLDGLLIAGRFPEIRHPERYPPTPVR